MGYRVFNCSHLDEAVATQDLKVGGGDGNRVVLRPGAQVHVEVLTEAELSYERNRQLKAQPADGTTPWKSVAFGCVSEALDAAPSDGGIGGGAEVGLPSAPPPESPVPEVVVPESTDEVVNDQVESPAADVEVGGEADDQTSDADSDEDPAPASPDAEPATTDDDTAVEPKTDD